MNNKGNKIGARPPRKQETNRKQEETPGAKKRVSSCTLSPLGRVQGNATSPYQQASPKRPLEKYPNLG